MNTDDDRKQLELATSSIPEQTLEPETAALREGWRVLSAALEKHNGHFDEAACLSKLQREIVVPQATVGTNSPRGGWMVVATLLGGALAASLLLMLSYTGGWFGPQPIAKPTQTVTPQSSLAATPNLHPGIGETDGSTWAWDDPLDSQISVAAAQMQTMQKPALPLDASISTLNYQLRLMAQDLDEGAL